MKALAWILWRRGLARAKHGFCPACYSSPPLPDCPVCEGDHRYGSGIEHRRAQVWRIRWAIYCEAIR